MKPTKKNNSLYPNTKYVNKDMYMTDNENNGSTFLQIKEFLND